MTAKTLRLILAMSAAFVLAVAILVAAAVGGLGLLDIARGYVTGESAYSTAQKAAVLALHRYAEEGDEAHFREYSRLIRVPLDAAQARMVLENPAVPRSESYGHLIESGSHPNDVRGIAWLFRTFGRSELMSEIIEVWRRSDEKIVELDAAAAALHSYLQSPGVTREGVQARVDRIDAIDAELAALGESFARNMGVAARELTRLLTIGIVALGLILIALVVAASIYVPANIRRFGRLLWEREKRFRDVAEMSGDWIWETDAENRLTFLSDRIEAVTGQPKEELLGTRRWDLAAAMPDTSEAHRQPIARRERIVDFEFEIKAADGTPKTIRTSGKPIYGEDGRYLGYRGTGTDVTAEVSAARDAARRRELLDNSFENLGQGIVIVDRDHKVVMVNRRLFEILEIPDDALKVGRSFEDFSHLLSLRGEYGPGDPDRLAGERFTLAAHRRPYVFERRRPNGQIIEVRGQPLPSGGFVAAYRDVTEKRMAQAAIESSERFMRGVVDSALDAFVSVDRSDRVLNWNPAAEKIFGWSRAEAIGRSLAELILPERLRPAHREVLASGMKGDGGRVTGGRRETVARRRDGTELPVEVSLSAQEIGGTVIFTAFIRDIRPRKQFEMRLMEAKEAAEAANSAKSQFLANMSHELRTPLNAIIGFAEIMVRQMMGPLAERYVEYAVDIRQSGSHLLDLINDILDISSVESGKATLPETEPVDLHQEVEACAHLLSRSAEENGVAISNEVPEEAPCLVAEPRRLRQILLNLIGNSVKFSPQGTTVSVRLDVGEDGLCLQVIDRGWGMAPEQVERVFEPFVQLHPGTAKASLGTGLGLTLVRNLVEMHGGRVVLQSAPGEGTTALVRFPASRIAHRGPAPKARGGARAGDLPR